MTGLALWLILCVCSIHRASVTGITHHHFNAGHCILAHNKHTTTTMPTNMAASQLDSYGSYARNKFKWHAYYGHKVQLILRPR